MNTTIGLCGLCKHRVVPPRSQYKIQTQEATIMWQVPEQGFCNKLGFAINYTTGKIISCEEFSAKCLDTK